ncbi:hypothetical protein A2V71_03765 [Candidatus Berkelbacteria bacterium RBG_13_40_8]|uniref:Uncharacterized protein n=1 Tax=Candidatus Berkelbacteria bacterium RBG_13_40_8 TaxID=1797467 RepID=A0A1F5DMS6_9BACT|nr:MAG: hypothetical protein A2V71_03765 [Candidatus Berkelbacteria bacterium RBG_13_40_8]
MSKKDKSKFRKQIKAQLLQEMAKAQTQEKPQSPIKVIQSPQPTITKVAPQPSSQTAVLESGPGDLSQIKYDLKKTGIVIGSLVVLMVILALLDLKYNILLSFGDILFRTFHIQ